MKQGFLVVCLWLFLTQSASSILVTIDREVTTPTFLSFDVAWNIGDTSSSDLVFDPGGKIEWRALGRDNFPTSLRLIDVFVEGHNFTLMDAWGFNYDEGRAYIPDQPIADSPPWATRSFTLLDPYSARITYTVPEPGVLSLAALFAGLWLVRRLLSSPRRS